MGDYWTNIHMPLYLVGVTASAIGLARLSATDSIKNARRLAILLGLLILGLPVLNMAQGYYSGWLVPAVPAAWSIASLIAVPKGATRWILVLGAMSFASGLALA